MAELRTGVSNTVWPVIPTQGNAQVMSLLYQLEHSQWDTPDIIAERQQLQLAELLEHALSTVPYYRETLANNGRSIEALIEGWEEFPVLTRSALQQAGKQLHSQNIPKDHGGVHPVQTSGSTGRPVSALMTGTWQLMHIALTLREHLWHERDVTGSLVAIRPDRGGDSVNGLSMKSWGRPVDLLYETGPSALLHSNANIDKQLAWLQIQQPTYLLSLPSNLRALAQACRAQNINFPGLRGVRSYGEMMTAAQRRELKSIWQVPVMDVYSAQEIGTMALQCPDHDHYHIQSESVLLEVLDDQGQPCEPGSIGRVVITTLHNFAMPLIRYEIMDHAEVGEPCPCGRGLPVIRQFLGRTRNLATRPDGGRFWPSFPAETWMDIAPIRQVQLIQTTRRSLTVNYAMDRTLSDAEQVAFTQALHQSLGSEYELRFVLKGGVIRSQAGKYEDFISELDLSEPTAK